MTLKHDSRWTQLLNSFFFSFQSAIEIEKTRNEISADDSTQLKLFNINLWLFMRRASDSFVFRGIMMSNLNAFADSLWKLSTDLWFMFARNDSTRNSFGARRAKERRETAKLIEISLLELSIAQAVSECLIIDLLIFASSTLISHVPRLTYHVVGKFTHFMSCACVNSIICYRRWRRKKFLCDDRIDESGQLTIKCFGGSALSDSFPDERRLHKFMTQELLNNLTSPGDKCNILNE